MEKQNLCTYNYKILYTRYTTVSKFMLHIQTHRPDIRRDKQRTETHHTHRTRTYADT